MSTTNRRLEWNIRRLPATQYLHSWSKILIYWSIFLLLTEKIFKIARPATNTTFKKPVIVYIHPGGFYGVSGQSKNFAGPQILMDRDIVLVTINYRLGSLGLLSLGTSEYPGNSAFKDQVLALKWVKYHIKNVWTNKWLLRNTFIR